MSGPTLYRVTFTNDGTQHPNWGADGPVSSSATVAAEDWETVGQVAASWVVSPVLGGAIAAAMFLLVRRTVLRREDPAAATRRAAPHLVALVIFLLVVSFVYKVLRNVLAAPPWWTTGRSTAPSET